eukprot:148903-Pyramimonas_sp.AAC.1
MAIPMKRKKKGVHKVTAKVIEPEAKVIEQAAKKVIEPATKKDIQPATSFKKRPLYKWAKE